MVSVSASRQLSGASDGSYVKEEQKARREKPGRWGRGSEEDEKSKKEVQRGEIKLKEGGGRGRALAKGEKEKKI